MIPHHRLHDLDLTKQPLMRRLENRLLGLWLALTTIQQALAPPTIVHEGARKHARTNTQKQICPAYVIWLAQPSTFPPPQRICVGHGIQSLPSAADAMPHEAEHTFHFEVLQCRKIDNRCHQSPPTIIKGTTQRPTKKERWRGVEGAGNQRTKSRKPRRNRKNKKTPTREGHPAHATSRQDIRRRQQAREEMNAWDP